MKLQVADQSGKVYSIDIDPTDNILFLKGKVGRQAGVSKVQEIKILFNGKELDNFSNLIQNQIKEGSVLNAQLPQAVPQPQPINQQNFFGGRAPAGPTGQMAPGPQNYANDPGLMQKAMELREYFINDTARLNQLLEQDPELAQALLSDNIQDSMIIIGQRVAFNQ